MAFPMEIIMFDASFVATNQEKKSMIADNISMETFPQKYLH